MKRRKHPRIDTDLVTTAKTPRRTMFQGKILKLSEGGAFLATGEKLSVGSEVILFLTLDIAGHPKSCMAQGKVVSANNERSRGPVGCGIAFDETSSSMKRVVRDFVEFKMKGKVSAMGVAENPKSTKPPGRGQLRG